eukprot:1339570-Prorocentrum_lima.AAC.1
MDANAGLAHVPCEEAPLLWNDEARCLGVAGGGHGRDFEFTLAVVAGGFATPPVLALGGGAGHDTLL